MFLFLCSDTSLNWRLFTTKLTACSFCLTFWSSDSLGSFNSVYETSMFTEHGFKYCGATMLATMVHTHWIHDCWHNKNRFELQGLQWTLIQVNLQSQPVHCLCHGDTALNYIWGLLGQSSLCRSLCSWEQRPFFQGGYVYKDLKEIQKWHYNLTTDCNSHPNCMVHVRYI